MFNVRSASVFSALLLPWKRFWRESRYASCHPIFTTLDSQRGNAKRHRKQFIKEDETDQRLKLRRSDGSVSWRFEWKMKIIIRRRGNLRFSPYALPTRFTRFHSDWLSYESIRPLSVIKANRHPSRLFIGRLIAVGASELLRKARRKPPPSQRKQGLNFHQRDEEWGKSQRRRKFIKQNAIIFLSQLFSHPRWAHASVDW